MFFYTMKFLTISYSEKETQISWQYDDSEGNKAC